jgi:hypothetical protein
MVGGIVTYILVTALVAVVVLGVLGFVIARRS